MVFILTAHCKRLPSSQDSVIAGLISGTPADEFASPRTLPTPVPFNSTKIDIRDVSKVRDHPYSAINRPKYLCALYIG